MTNNLEFDQIKTNQLMNLEKLINHSSGEDENNMNEPIYTQGKIDCQYYEPKEFNIINQFNIFNQENNNKQSYFHLNVQELNAHWENLQNLVCDLQTPNHHLDIIGLSEIF